MPVLVDTNVLIDVFTGDPIWAAKSERALEAAGFNNELAINDVIYAELSVRYARQEQLDAILTEIEVPVIRTPREALFLAGKAFLAYRRQGGVRTGVLADFFIGAHAAVTASPLLTRDTVRYSAYFPSVTLIGVA